MTIPPYYKGENKMRCTCCSTKKFDLQKLTKTEDGMVCPECLDRYYRSCRNCGTYFKKKAYYHMNCKKCEDNIYKANLNGYSTKPFPRFANFGSDSRDNLGCRYYGLEMEFNNTQASLIHKKMEELYNKSLLYNKSDSSIGRGVEVVTSPLDKKSLVKLLKDMEDTGFKWVDRNYHEGAGLHIHVNIETIDVVDRYKLSILLNKKCSLIEQNIMFYLSNRNSTPELLSENHHYCAIGSSKKYNHKGGLDRHIALNTRNINTFEFRLFKSSNDVKTILSYVYMVDSMIDFCHNNGIKDINITNYIVYLKNKKENELILNKIKEFEELHGEFIPIENITSSRYINSLLKGIKWYEYYKLLSYINADDCGDDKRALAMRILQYKKDMIEGKMRYKLSTRHSYTDDVSSMCLKTIKKVLINKIMKEASKCA